MGAYILYRSNHKPISITPEPAKAIPLALTGGFLDAVGGGGWGPIVASTLLAKGHQPRYVIGSVNMAEFFVTLSQALTFFFFLKLEKPSPDRRPDSGRSHRSSFCRQTLQNSTREDHDATCGNSSHRCQRAHSPSGHRKDLVSPSAPFSHAYSLSTQ